jgi:hypothetical protein
MKVLPLLPDEKRIELIRRGVDKMAFTGVGMLCLFLALPTIDWDGFAAMEPVWMAAAMIVCLVPPMLLLLWIEQKICNRKIWWTIGGLAWVGTFTLALSGYHIP